MTLAGQPDQAQWLPVWRARAANASGAVAVWHKWVATELQRAAVPLRAVAIQPSKAPVQRAWHAVRQQRVATRQRGEDKKAKFNYKLRISNYECPSARLYGQVASPRENGTLSRLVVVSAHRLQEPMCDNYELRISNYECPSEKVDCLQTMVNGTYYHGLTTINREPSTKS